MPSISHVVRDFIRAMDYKRMIRHEGFGGTCRGLAEMNRRDRHEITNPHKHPHSIHFHPLVPTATSHRRYVVWGEGHSFRRFATLGRAEKYYKGLSKK